MLPAECGPITTRAEQLAKAAKTRSKAVHRKEAQEALDKLRLQSPACFVPEGEPALPPAPSNALPVYNPITGVTSYAPSPVAQPQPVISASGTPWMSIILGGLAVVGLGYAAYSFMKPKGRKR